MLPQTCHSHSARILFQTNLTEESQNPLKQVLEARVAKKNWGKKNFISLLKPPLSVGIYITLNNSIWSHMNCIVTISNNAEYCSLSIVF